MPIEREEADLRARKRSREVSVKLAAQLAEAKAAERSDVWRMRWEVAKTGGCVVLGLAIVLATLFALVYLVVLAARLAWGAS